MTHQPTLLPTMPVCAAHAGMVSRDQLDAIQNEMEERCDEAREALELERRRIDTIIGLENDNGKLSSALKRIAKLEKLNDERRKAMLKYALTFSGLSIGGSGGLYAIVRAYIGG